MLRAHEAAPIRKALRHTIHRHQSEKKRSAAPTLSLVPGQGDESVLSFPAAQIAAATGLPRKTLSAASGPACTSPPRRSRAWNAPQLVPCTSRSLCLIFHLFPFLLRLRPTWNANSLNRILCLFCSRALYNHMFLVLLLFSCNPSISCFSTGIVSFVSLPSLPPFPFPFLYFICARWHRTLLL